MVKRKNADRSNWNRVKEKICLIKQQNNFNGTIVYLGFKQVYPPLWKQYSKTLVKILDNNYWWIQFFPTDQSYTITVMIDEQGCAIQWYIDICKAHGIGTNGIPWYDDIYLDIVVLPDEKTELLDYDEFITAYQHGSISKTDYQEALQTATTLLKDINQEISFYQKLLKEIRCEIEKYPL